MPDDFTDALFIAQTLIQRRAAEAPLTREMIGEEVARALAVEPRWRETVDNDALCRELECQPGDLVVFEPGPYDDSEEDAGEL
jgi:hypothetical protein